MLGTYYYLKGKNFFLVFLNGATNICTDNSLVEKTYQLIFFLIFIKNWCCCSLKWTYVTNATVYINTIQHIYDSKERAQ